MIKNKNKSSPGENSMKTETLITINVKKSQNTLSCFKMSMKHGCMKTQTAYTHTNRSNFIKMLKSAKLNFSLVLEHENRLISLSDYGIRGY